MADSKQAEKDYLARTGSSVWETFKPFSPAGTDTVRESAQLLHDFSVAMLALDPSPDDRILDLGAGGGWCSDLLGRLNRSSVAVDLSLDMLRAGRQRPSPVRAVAGDMEALPFRPGSFQKAVCFSALHHVPDMRAAIGEIARVLDDRGIAFFSEPGEGHADAAVSTAAMRDYGVLEQDVLVEDILRDCRAAGFVDVRVKPLSYSIPRFELTDTEWTAWSKLADSKRPHRALEKMMLAVVELLGLGKQGVLFEETFAIKLVRTLRAVVSHHPVVIASKRPLPSSSDRPEWQASIAIEPAPQLDSADRVGVSVRARNEGTATWQPSSRSGVGHVSIGLQLLDADGRIVSRDHHRIALPHPVPPGGSVQVSDACPKPTFDGAFRLKADLVAEGVAWFEMVGSAAPTLLFPTGR